MIGIVLVSHSSHLVQGIAELLKMMSRAVPVSSAGGLEDGSFGTSFEKISAAIDSIYSDDGVLIFCDMGSAIMTAEMVVESMPERRLCLVDAPIVEGALVAAMASLAGESLDGALAQLKEPNAFVKGIAR